MGAKIFMSRYLALALASAISLGGLSTAMAADMPLKAIPAPAPVYNWTGFYIGAEAGGDFGRSQVIHGPNDPSGLALNTPITNPFDITSGLAGITAGYNYQISQWVVGIEGDISWVRGGASAFDVAPFNSAFSQLVQERWNATVRGRVGYTVLPNLLVYGTGGWADSSVRQTVSDPTFAALAPIVESHTMSGWTAGFGLEWKFYGPWSAKAEFLYADLGQKSFFNPPANTVNYASDQQVRLHDAIVRFGVNYQFNTPIVAKY
jgi:outer membrane immunogenic protein